ncbi:hypothetical protein ACFL4G_04505 [Thermodesulfobacteriota bacterium]
MTAHQYFGEDDSRPDSATAIAPDGAGNVYVTGKPNFCTIKYTEEPACFIDSLLN